MPIGKLKYITDPGRARKKAEEYKINIKREFQPHKCLLHHYDVIDFTMFEFGFRVIYLPYRLSVSILIPLLALTLHEELSEVTKDATPRAPLSYMHFWLIVALSVQAFVDVVTLTWTIIKYPTCELVKLRWLPFYFQIAWVLHNMVFPNVLATGFMYNMYFHMDKVLSTDKYLLLALIFYAGVHIGVTGVPTRIAHFVHPLSFTFIYITFTVLYQAYGGTDPKGNRYVYADLDWAHTLDATLGAILWIVVTMIFHFSMAAGTWGRRAVFRRLRKGKEAIMNPDPDDDSSLCSIDQDGMCNDFEQESPRIWIEDIPNDPHGHKRVIVESPTPSAPSCRAPQNIFHEVMKGPYVPGEKRKRLVIETEPKRVCFSPTGTGRYPRELSVEKSFICHPDVSTPGSSVYMCMPETNQSRVHKCYACDHDRKLDRADLKAGRPLENLPEDNTAAYTFTLEHPTPNNPYHPQYFYGKQPIPTKPLVCPRNEYKDSTSSSKVNLADTGNTNKKRKSVTISPKTSGPTAALPVKKTRSTLAPKEVDSEGSICSDPGKNERSREKLKNMRKNSPPNKRRNTPPVPSKAN